MTQSFPRRDQLSQLQTELIKLGSPAAKRDVPLTRSTRNSRPVYCTICKVIARRLTIAAQWFEMRAEAHG